METLRNKRKLAAVSRETPEISRNSREQNTLDAESTQDYISQVSDEIEGRVTKKLSKEFSRTKSRILGALSNLEEFLLNPQVRTCSVAVPGASRNNNSENRETTGDRPSDDSYPEVRYSSHHSGHLNSPEAEDYPHRNNLNFTILQLSLTRPSRNVFCRQICFLSLCSMPVSFSTCFEDSYSEKRWSTHWCIIFLKDGKLCYTFLQALRRRK